MPARRRGQAASTAARSAAALVGRCHPIPLNGSCGAELPPGSIPATTKVLERAGLTIDDIDAFEVDEAVSSVVLAWQAETGAPLEKVNANGGAIAIGHPLGASGARLATTLLGVLEQTDERDGLQSMCEAGGLSNATIVERL